MSSNQILNRGLIMLGVLLLGTAALGISPEARCQQRKLRAHGKLELCLAKNAAKAIIGKPDGSASCYAKRADALAKAGPCRFIDNGDGSITDFDTGLMWEKKDTNCPQGLHCYMESPGATEWQTDFLYGEDLTPFRPGLNFGASSDGSATTGCFAGHCDWRIPKVEELLTILDITRGNCAGGVGPCIDPVFGPTLEDCYQTSSTVTGTPTDNWKVSFWTGWLQADNRDYGYPVRAVRGGRP